MTRKEQVKILNDKIEANRRQYDLDRINAEISAYSSGDLPKYEYLTKKDLGYKPDSIHHQLQYALGSFGLTTQAQASMYVSNLIQFIISCRTHWDPLA